MAKFLAYRKKLSTTEDDISSDADIWLFAEDLLNFVFRNHVGFPIKPTGEERRKCVHKGFTNTVKCAVEITHRKLSAEIENTFAEMSKEDDIVDAYCKHVTHLRKLLRAGGFDGNQCIHYCVLVAFLGEKFYRTGLHDFHFQTFAAVRRGFKKSDMSNGGWNTLESAAEEIIALEGPIEKLRGSVPSPDIEQSPLDADEEQRHIDSVLDIIHSDDDCLSDGSVGSNSSIAKVKSLNSKGSNESLRIFNVSDDEKDKPLDLIARNLFSPRKRPVQSSTISSSTEILKYPSPKDDFLKPYTEQSFRDADTNPDVDNFHNAIIDFLDLSTRSAEDESCSELRLNTTSPEHSSPSDQVVRRNKTESKNVDIRSENSSETGSSQKENEIPLHWSFSLPVEQVSKPNSESRRLPVFSELSTKVKEPNSAESTASASKSPDFSRFKSS